MWLRRRATVRNGDIFDTMAPGVHRLMQRGVSLEQALELAVPALHEALDKQTPRVVRRLVRRAPRILRHHKRANRRFERRLRKQWGQALDRFYAIVVFTEEMGRELYGLHLKEVDDEEFHPVFEALIGLHARACRVAREVHHLLSGGFPFAHWLVAGPCMSWP
jgi:hypothetical protein